MAHFSMSGTTCWYCGHPAGGEERTTRVELQGEGAKRRSETYRSCRNCRHASGDREAVRAARNTDVEGMKALLRGEPYKAVYWTQGKLEQLAQDMRGWGVSALNKLNWKEYADNEAVATQTRTEANRKAYDKTYNKTRKAERKEFYNKAGGKEKAAELYHQGGGKEAAKLRYVNGGREAAAKRYAERKAALAREALELDRLLEELK